MPELMELVPGRARPAVQALRGARHGWRMAPQLVAQLDAFAEAARVTPFMLSLAAFMVLLQRYSRRDDIVVGTPTSGRSRPETQQLIGFFANTLALRVDAAGDPSFTAFLGRVRSCVLDGFANQDVPFEKVVDAVGLRRSRSHGTLIQILFTHRHDVGIEGDRCRSRSRREQCQRKTRHSSSPCGASDGVACTINGKLDCISVAALRSPASAPSGRFPFRADSRAGRMSALPRSDPT